jgi:hypothetical protein
MSHVSADLCKTLILIISALLVFIPFTGKVSDNRRKWYNVVNYKGWLMIVLTITGLYLTNLKDSILQNQQDVEKLKTIQ